MRTLGLCPHLVINNLGRYSDKSIDLIQNDLAQIDKTNNFKVEEIFENEEQIQENNPTIESDDESTT